MSNVRYLSVYALCRVSDMRSLVTEVLCLRFDVRFAMSDFLSLSSNVCCLIADVRRPMSDL